MNTKPIQLMFVLMLMALLACNATKTLPLKDNSKMGAKSSNTEDEEKIVRSLTAFDEIISNAKPGDKIILANGIWKDVELKFVANGNESNPIYIIAEEKGKVFFEGQSNIKMGGSYVHLEGIVFRNGFTPTSSVIAFQKDKSTPCNNCRVTECVIDNYNPSERFDTDYWIEVFGKNNRFDHNYLVGKRNRGVTLAVRLKNDHDRENNHRIDHNYFGYRPILGSNGGETLRIGTSHYSLSNSNTIVEDNYFERCSGELEIISSKSCRNTFINNCFYECQGTLSMRHGNETLVENNYLLGNGQPNTGGIRVINETQTVKNNYLKGLTGYRFKGALVIMNGVPNSPLNRYFQVKDSEMSNNLVVDSDYIQLCAGSDEERSATPENTTFKNNIISNKSKNDVFTVYDDISGIAFKNNIISSNIELPNFEGKIQTEGIRKAMLELPNDKYSYQLDSEIVGIQSKRPMPNADNTGVSWYPKNDNRIHFRIGKSIEVKAGENNLFNAIKSAEEGDVLVLMEGNHHLTRSILVDKTITIRGVSSNKNPNITFERSPLFALENGGSLELENLDISGAESDDYSGNAVIRTSRYSMINNYKLMVKSCNIMDLDVNHSFNFLKVYKNTFADSILFKATNFENITGHILNMNKEIDAIGIYNVEDVEIVDCQFVNIGGNAINLYRGGRDESTFGPIIKLKDSTFENVGHDQRNKNESAVELHGVQLAELNNLNFKDSRKLKLHLIVGEPVIKLSDIDFDGCEKMTSNDDAYQSNNINFKNIK